jgi:multimeric flavodoxin WrbA
VKKQLLIIHHSQSGNTERLASAVEAGALRVTGTDVKRLLAAETTAEDLLACRCLVICTPEYFGYMAGAIKDLFDRTYEEVRGLVIGKSYALVVCAGNDGTGALNSMERIIAGLNLKRVQEPIISRGEISEALLDKCSELGETLAAGIDLGIY